MRPRGGLAEPGALRPGVFGAPPVGSMGHRVGGWGAALASLLLTCGGGSPDAAAPQPAAAPTDLPAAGDPLLARARAALRDGELPADLRDELLASDDPAHARARRVLGALDGDPADAGGSGGSSPQPAASADLGAAAPRIAAPEPEAASASVRSSPRAGASSGRGASDGAGSPARPPGATRGRPSLRRMSLREVRAGKVVLTVGGSGGVAVGLVNMPESGLVRLVFEASGASPRVLGMRGRAGGVRVQSVRRVSQSVFVTLALDPGWSVATMTRVPSGARVVLQGP